MMNFNIFLIGTEVMCCTSIIHKLLVIRVYNSGLKYVVCAIISDILKAKVGMKENLKGEKQSLGAAKDIEVDTLMTTF